MIKIKTSTKYLEVSGPPQKRGHYIGRTLKPFIWEGFERFRYILKNQGNDLDSLARVFLQNTSYMKAAEKWAPELLLEVEGMAEGAGIDFDIMFAYQCLDEIGRFFPKTNVISSGNCTSIGINKNKLQSTILGQNLDSDKLMGWVYQGLTSVMRIKNESEIESLVISNRPGSIGIVGMNNCGIGVVVNTIDVQSSRDGLPLSFMIRSILECKTLDEAREFVKTVRIGAAQNLMLGDPKCVIDLECSGNKVAEFSPYNNATRCYHTNHPLANMDVIPDFNYPTERTNSHDRYDYLDFRMGKEKTIYFENMQGILRSHYGGICRHPEFDPREVFTWFSVLYKLSKNPTMYIADGNPCCNIYQTFSFTSK